MLLLLLAAQTAAPVVPPPPERFSILAPVGPQKCAPREVSEGEEGDVVVCATDLPDQTIPYPQEYVGNRPRPSNPDLSGTGALAAEGTPCATTQGGCQVGFGPPIMPVVAAIVDEVKWATRKRDKRPRVPIDLSEPTARKLTP
ncbi:hypothetical protein [Sphingomonas lenta]|uniref:Uncharacterized protein n=1 Tax=Sphingomonas lenta TaxID=1141887 RepID=A0A2A2SD33_9SPHN|nr:hypothetical protein [Sphingomonas lenta]PAX07158.1 hypothetical protein CKY28_14040 [Sphingomonas lenta]